jgi:hypothetical protein
MQGEAVETESSFMESASEVRSGACRLKRQVVGWYGLSHVIG